MNEKQTSSQDKPIRPTKKQREILGFVEAFIDEHGYSPSYREIMAALNYTSVATVALHVNNLIKRGHLRKRDHSARSLETVNTAQNVPAGTAGTAGTARAAGAAGAAGTARAAGAASAKITTNQVKPAEEKWLVEKVEHVFRQAEAGAAPEPGALDGLETLVGALKVLGLEGASQSFVPRLTELRRRAGAGSN